VLAITPNVQKRQVRVHAEAKSLASMLSYQRKLEETRLFTDVVLNEHEVQVQDPEKPVRFNVTLTWPL
jgi:type IV pilus assembly PilN-like protein